MLFPAFILAARVTRRTRPFVAALALALAAYALFNWSQYGAPWTTGYGAGAHADFVAGAFARNLAWLTSLTWTLLTPFLILPALWALLTRFRERLELFLWFAPLFFVYCFFAAMGNEWWYARYLLPAYPPLFVLSALGWHELLGLSRRWRDAPVVRQVLASSAVVGGLYHFGMLGMRYDVYKPDRHRGAFLDSVSVAKLVPRESMVGATELSGLLRLYGNLETFELYGNKRFDVMDLCLSQGIPLFVVVQPWDHVDEVLARYEIADVTPLESSPEIYVARVTVRKRRRASDD
jgi:hypothetical protein